MYFGIDRVDDLSSTSSKPLSDLKFFYDENASSTEDAASFSSNTVPWNSSSIPPDQPRNWQKPRTAGGYFVDKPVCNAPSFGAEVSDVYRTTKNGMVWENPEENSMVWRDPYAKKQSKPDLGTAVWGDPSRQGPIARWKAGEVIAEGGSSQPLSCDQKPSMDVALNGDKATKEALPENGSTMGWGELASSTTSSADATTWFNRADKQYSAEIKPMGWDYGGNTTQGPSQALMSNQDCMFNRTIGRASEADNQKLGYLSDGPKFGNYDAPKTNPLRVDCLSSNATTTTNSFISPTVSTMQSRQMLIQQHMERLRRYIQMGLLDSNVLENPTKEKLERLHEFFNYAAKWEAIRKVYSQMQQTPHYSASAPSQQDMQKVSVELEKLTGKLADVNHKIKSLNVHANGKRMVAQEVGQSKLDQWKQGSNGTKGQLTIADYTASNFGFGVANENVWSALHSNGATDWPSANNAKDEAEFGLIKELTDPADDPVIIAAVDEMTRDDSFEDDKRSSRTVTPVDGSTIAQATSNRTTPTILNTFDANVPEFKPGQPWHWRDPKELAQEPDATPANVSLKKAALVNGAKSSNAGSGTGTTATMMNGMNGLHLTEDNVRGHVTTKYPSASILPTARNGSSAWIHGGPQDAWVPSNEPQLIRAPPVLIAQQPPHVAGGHVRGVPYMSLKTRPSTFPMTWVVLSNLNMMEENSLHTLLQQVAPMTSFWYLRQAGFAAVKFKDLEKVLPRLHMECAGYGIIVQLAKDEDVSMLLQSVNGSHGAGVPSVVPVSFANTDPYEQAAHRRAWGAAQPYGAYPAYHVSAIRPI